MAFHFATNSDLLFYALVISSLTAAILFLGIRIFFRFIKDPGAAIRYQFWFSGLILLAWLTLFGLITPHFHRIPGQEAPGRLPLNAEPNAAQAETFMSIESLASLQQITSHLQDDPTAHKPEKSATNFGSTVRRGFVLIWMVGVLFFLVKMLLTRWRLRHFSRRLTPAFNPSIQSICRNLTERLGIAKMPRIVFSEDVNSPMVLGIFRPKVILPIAASHWCDARIECVLGHELGHIKRDDLIYQWLGDLIATCHWFNPLAWSALAEMRKDREEVCDNIALGLGVKPSNYATSLLCLSNEMKARPWQQAMGPTMAGRCGLGQRIRAVLDISQKRQDTSKNIKRVLFLGTLVLGLPMAQIAKQVRLSLISPEAKLQLAHTAFEHRDWKKGAAWFRVLETDRPQLPIDWYRYAFCLEQSGDLQGAFRALQTSIQLVGYPDSALMSSVAWLEAQDQKATAEKIWQEWFSQVDPVMIVAEKSPEALPLYQPAKSHLSATIEVADKNSYWQSSSAKNPQAMNDIYKLRQALIKQYPQALVCRSFKWVQVFPQQESQSVQKTVFFEKLEGKIYDQANLENYIQPMFDDFQMPDDLSLNDKPVHGVLSCSISVSSDGRLIAIQYSSLPQNFNRKAFEKSMLKLTFKPGTLNGQPVNGTAAFALGFSAT